MKYSAFTLIELLIALSLSLFLLLGVTEMFRNVGTSINDTQSTLNMASNLNSTALRLRRDLQEMSVSPNPHPLTPSSPPDVTLPADPNGYLEIIEGMNLPYSLLNANTSGNHLPASYLNASNQRVSNVFVDTDNSSDDFTPGDVDDILAFTATRKGGNLFRGRIDGQIFGLSTQDCIAETKNAEIIWFVRGNTLYRRQLLVGTDLYVNKALQTIPSPLTVTNQFYQYNDLSVRRDGSNYGFNNLTDLARRENRFAHNRNNFPYPLYNGNYEAWYFFGLPLLEEQATSPSNFLPGHDLPNLSTGTNYDELFFDNQTIFNNSGVRQRLFRDPWGAPNTYSNPNANWAQNSDSGSITTYIPNTNNRSQRTGEDIVLTNVLSFDVKVWNPYWVPCVPLGAGKGANASAAPWLWAPPQYVDLGQDRFRLLDASNNWQDCEVNYQQTSSAPTGIPNNTGIGFCSKGRYSNTSIYSDTNIQDRNDRLARNVSLNGTLISSVTPDAWQNAQMRCVYDTWTTAYEKDPSTFMTTRPTSLTDDGIANRDNTKFDPISIADTIKGNHNNWECPPPYSTELKSIQVTIRCFDPASGNIRQIRVVQAL